MTDQLKPCPFCGGEAEIIYSHGGRYPHYVECKKCRVRTEGSAFENDEYNTEAWNRRHNPAAEQNLAPCPCCPATKCIMDEPCLGCEVYSRWLRKREEQPSPYANEPCHWCKSKKGRFDSYEWRSDTGHTWNWVCENCGARGPTAPTEKEAMIAWNRRHSEWISAEERLPEEGEIVDIWYRGKRCPDYTYDEEFGWQPSVHGICHAEPTYWMIKPPAPETGGEG